MEVCWTYSLKALSMQRIKEIAWAHSLGQPALLLPVLPLLAYVGFGLANVIFLSQAMRTIPTATATRSLALDSPACRLRPGYRASTWPARATNALLFAVLYGCYTRPRWRSPPK